MMKHFIALFFLSVFSFMNAQTLVPYRDKNLWGYSDESGNVKISPKYDSVTFFETKFTEENVNRFAKVNDKGKYGLIDEKGKMVLDAKYKMIDIDRGEYGMSVIVQNENGKFGVYNFNTLLIPEEFDKIEFIRNDSFLVKKNRKIGMIDHTGQTVIPVEYQQINYIEGNAKEVKWLVSNDKETKYITTPAAKFSNRSTRSIYQEGFSPPGATKTADAAAVEKLKAKYNLSKCDPYYKEKCIYRQNNKYGFYDFEINKKTKPEYESLKIIKSSGDKTYLLATKNEKNLLIDELGNSLIPVDFQEIEDRYDRLTFTKDNRKGFYFIDTQKYVEPKYQLHSWNNTLYTSGPIRNLELIPVYTDHPKDWFYIGSNGLIFKTK